MAESISVYPMEEEPLLSQTQISLTPEQRDRIAKQKELALARRSAKVVLQNSIPASSSQSDGDQNLSVPGRASDLLAKVRFSQPLSSLRQSSFTGTSLNPFLKFARKPFTPPVQVIDLEEDSHGDEAHGSVNVGNTPKNEAYSRVSAGNKQRNGACGINEPKSRARVRKRQKRNSRTLHSPYVKDSVKSIMDAKDSEAKDRIDAKALDRTHFEARTEDSRSQSNNEKWISVRKRTLPGHIFGKINQEMPNNGVSLVENMEMGAASQINSNLLSAKRPRVKLALSCQQRKVLLAIAAGKSVFLTGSAGTGKSYLLQEAVYTLKNMYGSNSVFVTASTGLAACAIGGTTLHSFAGIGLGMGEKRELANKVSAKRDARKRWIECSALIIDEISMIDGELFDKLEYVARAVRGPACKNKVFGGVQLVVTGDFFQLPPVQPENPEKYFAFQADCWNDCFELQVELTQVFRQSDSEFVEMLNELRKGQCSPTTEVRLKCCDRPVQATNTGILMTKLYPRKMDVGKENEQKLMSLNQETVAFIAKDDGKGEFALRQLENVRAKKELYLSVGAQVMLVKNVDSTVGLVNGARGVVVRFTSIEELDEGKDLAKKLSPSGLWPVVLFACDGVERVLRPENWSIMDGNTEVAKRSQIPLILAWALSVHKCQGMTLDRVEIDLSRSFEYGMVYVALSRVKCLDGLRLAGFDASLIRAHNKVLQFYEELKTGEL